VVPPIPYAQRQRPPFWRGSHLSAPEGRPCARWKETALRAQRQLLLAADMGIDPGQQLEIVPVVYFQRTHSSRSGTCNVAAGKLGHEIIQRRQTDGDTLANLAVNPSSCSESTRVLAGEADVCRQFALTDFLCGLFWAGFMFVILVTSIAESYAGAARRPQRTRNGRAMFPSPSQVVRGAPGDHGEFLLGNVRSAIRTT
jgi:hypothetical protein